MSGSDRNGETRPLIVLEVWQLLLLGVVLLALVGKVAGLQAVVVLLLLGALVGALVARSRKRAAG